MVLKKCCIQEMPYISLRFDLFLFSIFILATHFLSPCFSCSVDFIMLFEFTFMLFEFMFLFVQDFILLGKR